MEPDTQQPIQEEFDEQYIPDANWKKWEQVGDTIKGTFIRKYFKASNDSEYPDQWVFEICNVTDNGIQVENYEEVFKVPIKATNTFVLDRLSRIKPGQRIGFKFDKEIPPKRKGFNPAKSIVPYVWGMDQAFNVKKFFGGEIIENFDEPQNEEGQVNVSEGTSDPTQIPFNE